MLLNSLIIQSKHIFMRVLMEVVNEETNKHALEAMVFFP